MLDRKLYHDLVDLKVFEEALAEREKDFTDQVVPATSLSMDAATGNMVVRNGRPLPGEHPLQDQTLTLIGMKLQIPGEYLRRCPPALRAENVNYWLKRLGPKNLLVRFDREEVRAILTTRYVPVSNLSLIQGFRRFIRNGHEPQVRFEVNPRRLVAQVLTDQGEPTSSAKEGIRGGIQLTNSETGFAALSLSAVLYRLVCTNGLVIAENLGLKRIHIAKKDGLFQAIEEKTRLIMTFLPRAKDRLVQAQERRVANPSAVFTRLNKRFDLTEAQGKAVESAWPREEGNTLFHLVNTYTRAGNDPGLSLDERQALQQVGGRILTAVEQNPAWLEEFHS